MIGPLTPAEQEVVFGLRVAHVVTVPSSLGFFHGYGAPFRGFGMDVQMISGPGEGIDAFAAREGLPVHIIDMARQITPFADAAAVVRLTRLLRRLDVDVVHSHTPKGGLLGVLAGRASRARLVVYQLRGLPLATATGTRGVVLRAAEVIATRGAHRLIAESESLRVDVAERGIAPFGRMTVLAHGGNGVDSRGRFDPLASTGARRELRARLQIAEGDVAVLFVGRLAVDKGLRELAEAWERVRVSAPHAHLVLVGGNDERDGLAPAELEALRRGARIHVVGAQSDVVPWYRLADVFVLPTYREGLPNVLLEAAAMNLPVVATRVTGCVDCVRDGVTGALVPARDAAALAEALTRYVGNRALRERHGSAGRAYMLSDFEPAVVQLELARFYARALLERGFKPARR